MESHLLTNYNILLCCKQSCCSEVASTSEIDNENSFMKHGETYDDDYDYNTYLLAFFASVYFMISLLYWHIMFNVNVQEGWNRILPQIWRESSLPFSQLLRESSLPISSTKLGTDGMIIPGIPYSEHPRMGLQKKDKLEDKHVEDEKEQQILNAKNLLEKTTTFDTKIVDEEIFLEDLSDSLEASENSSQNLIESGEKTESHIMEIEEKNQEEHTLIKLPNLQSKRDITISCALAPPYYPSRLVSEVWMEDTRLDLYNFSNLDRLVLPPPVSEVWMVLPPLPGYIQHV